jgi:hypothetical protein
MRAGLQCAADRGAVGRLLVRQIASGAEAVVKVCGVAMAMLPG